ncbi:MULTISPECIES: hypothetical protein [unclassified Rhizobium]|jgi:hypothetical protein|uniref:hypothetical protein n=1 Tax=unclassified Rhizobium TaxID=2613769 RepID=UPI000DD55FE5|nr:hypothetical protein [Rhizobium sp. UBA1881]
MTSLNTSQTMGQTTRGNHRSDEASSDTWYPQSLMLRMMQNASRSMAHSMGRNLGRTGAPRLDPQSMSENLRRDIGVIDWGSCDRER